MSQSNWSGYGALPPQFEVKQDIEYAYRSHFKNDCYVIERCPLYNPPIPGVLSYWKYWMTAQTQEHADDLVAKAKQKPHYKYY